MVFLYDWKKIFEVAEKNPLSIFVIFRMMVERQIPKNKYDKIFSYSKKNFVGESFLINPEDLLFHSYKYSYREIAQYLALASLRSYADYLATGDATLDLRRVEVDLELFKDNRLLYIKEGNKLLFKYEEVPPKEKQH